MIMGERIPFKQFAHLKSGLAAQLFTSTLIWSTCRGSFFQSFHIHPEFEPAEASGSTMEALCETQRKIGVEPKIGVGPQNGWFIMENPINS